MFEIAYQYSLAAYFGGTINPSRLKDEIQASDITIALDRIDVDDDQVSIIFKGQLSSSEKAILEDGSDSIIANHDPSEKPLVNVLGAIDDAGVAHSAKADADGNIITTFEPPSGDKLNFFSINWCDKCSWYEGSIKQENEVLTADSSGKIFQSNNSHWIDMSHGRITQEHMLTKDGTYLPIITIDDVVIDPNTATEGGYEIDYENGRVIFNETQTGEVKATYWYASSGTFTAKPPEGFKMKLLRVEIQFSKSIELKDSMVFQAYGYAGVFAPQLGYPPTTLIPLDDPNIYNNTKDFINESNGSYTIIPAFGGKSRGLSDEVIILVWDYLSKTELYSSAGMEIRIDMLNNMSHVGEYATATFYSIATPE